jgi:hypothetical protein
MRYHFANPVSYNNVAVCPAVLKDILLAMFAFAKVTVWPPLLEDIIIILICPSVPAARVHVPAAETSLIHVTFVATFMAPAAVIVS